VRLFLSREIYHNGRRNKIDLLVSNNKYKMKNSLLTLSLLAMLAAVQVSPAQKLPIVNGRAASLPKPDFPIDAEIRCAKGEVRVRIEYLAGGGSPLSAKMIAGNELLRPAAEEAALGARFNLINDVHPKTKLSGLLVYNFSARPGFFCIDTGKALNDRTTKSPQSSIDKKSERPEKETDIKVDIVVDYVGQIIFAKADDTAPAVLKAYAESFAREVRFSPTNDMGNIRVRGFLIIRFKPNGSVTLAKMPAQK
jgi:hypothetical protein